MLGLITCFFNPTNSEVLRSNYSNFRKHLNHPITTIELAFDNFPFFIDDSIKVRGNRNHIMFQKERLLNLALKSLPNNVDKVAWLDADIIFENPNWFEETETALDSLPVVQLFEEVFESSEIQNPVNQGVGIGKVISEHGPNAPWSEALTRIGIAWAARREVLNKGFFDRHILGAGDRLMLAGWMGWWDCSRIQRLPPVLRREYLLWAKEIHELVNQRIGYVKGRIQHLPHGSVQGRGFDKRAKVLVKRQFNPETDIMLDINNIYKFTLNNPKLLSDTNCYFRNRNEDIILQKNKRSS